VDVVHQEDERLGILRQVAQRNVLLVAAEVGEAQRPFIDDPQEARPTTAVLNVRLPFGVRRREVELAALADELLELIGDLRFPSLATFDFRVQIARALRGLNRLYGRCERYIARVRPHGESLLPL